jgi:PAS domain S-box-containing protein
MVRALLESAPQAILSMDHNGRIVLSNARTEKMFGYSRQELLGARIEVLLPDFKRPTHDREREGYLTQLRARPISNGKALVGRRKVGTEFPVEISLSYVKTAEGVFGIAFVNDISDHERLEDQPLQAPTMEALGGFAGGVAHDFNNMLTVIVGHSRLMLDEFAPLNPLRGCAEEVLKAAHKAAALTKQLLDFSRIHVMQLCVMNVNETVMHTEKMLRRLIAEDVELVLRLPDDVGNILADPNHIEQAIVNLAVNASDAMPMGGHITVETANVNLGETCAWTHTGVKPGDFVMVAVSDTGQGMDAETRRRLFEPFFSTKTKDKSTGLGLAMVYGTVKQLGGDIWVDSELGQGTTIKLFFPRLAEAATETATSGEEFPER